MPKIEGTWPENDIRRAFVEGAEWLAKGIMWSVDRKFAEEEAEERYGVLLVDKRRSENEIREELERIRADARNAFSGIIGANVSAMAMILEWVLNEED